MPTSSNMIGHIYITELVYKQKLYVWYSCCCYELRVITEVMEDVTYAVGSQAPFQSVRDGIKNFRCRAEAER